MEEERRIVLLNECYNAVHSTMLYYQSHTLGLFPRGQSRHARVRDNVYCAAALWHLSVAYSHVGDDKGRTHELEKNAIKCTRGLLFCYMRQSDKVERFKHKQSWEDALHSRFDCYTGDAVTEDNGWGHLQIDGTSLFLLVLAQMISAGLQVVFTMDEVDFIQNLVYYVERAYRIPDYGMWERGSRDNVGKRELHASSIGMAKAALDAINGLNMFGSEGSSLSIIHVDPDAQYRNSIILDHLLPRESSSKETDASLLCIIGYPAFSIDDPALCRETEERTRRILGPEEDPETAYGFKRFLRDGHHTVKENPTKKYYDPAELARFEGIECEWPLFYLIVVLTELCRGHKDEADKYWKKLEKCIVIKDGQRLVPRLYYVPKSELAEDGESVATARDLSFSMEPMLEAIPFQWAQALYLTTKLAKEGLISLTELDPLGLHLPHSARNSGMARHLGYRAPGHNLVIQVALIAETARLQSLLATHGIQTQTQKEVEPIKIKAPGDVLMKVFQHIGENKKLGLSGRPMRPIGALATSKVYKIFGQTVVFYPTDSMTDFYTSFDAPILIHYLKFTLAFINLYWNMGGKPTVCLFLTESGLKGHFSHFINFLAELKHGTVAGVKVRLDRLQALISTSSIEHLEFGGEDDNLDRALIHRLAVPLRSASMPYMSTSSDVSHTSVTGMAGTTGDDVFDIDQAEMEIDVENVGEEVEPVFSPTDLRTCSSDKLKQMHKNESNLLGEVYIIHELIKRNEMAYLDLHQMTITERMENIYVAAGAKNHWKTVRLAAAVLNKVVDTLAPAITSVLVRGKEVTFGVFGYPEHVISEPLSPKALVKIIYDNCLPYDPIEAVLQQEIIVYLGIFVSSTYRNTAFEQISRLRVGWIVQAMKRERQRMGDDKSVYHMSPYDVMQLLVKVLHEDEERTPLDKRQLNGALNRVPKDFYTRVYSILEKISGGIQVRRRELPQLPTIHELGAHEKVFSMKVEELLGNISQPEYRQMIVECLMVVSTILERNPELEYHDVLDLDEILKHAQDMFKEDCKKDVTDSSSPTSPQADPHIGNFYALQSDGPLGSTSYMARAVVNKLLKEGLHYHPNSPNSSCLVS